MHGNDIVVGIVMMIVMSEMSEGVIGLSINRNAGGSHGQRAQQQQTRNEFHSILSGMGYAL